MASLQIPPENRFITLKEAAGILRISTDFMRDIINGRRGTSRPKVVRLRNVIRIPYQDFMLWVDQRATPPRQRKK